LRRRRFTAHVIFSGRAAAKDSQPRLRSSTGSPPSISREPVNSDFALDRVPAAKRDKGLRGMIQRSANNFGGAAFLDTRPARTFTASYREGRPGTVGSDTEAEQSVLMFAGPMGAHQVKISVLPRGRLCAVGSPQITSAGRHPLLAQFDALSLAPL